MLNAYDLGVDERAAALLGNLAEDKQQAILQKLSEGTTEGKIRNASAYVASACQKPDALGIDDRATELLKQLPKQRRTEVLEKLRNTEGIKNPSAWVAKACLKDIPQQPVQQVWQAAPQWTQQQWAPAPAYGKDAYGKGGYGKGGYGAGYGGGYGAAIQPQKGYGGKGGSPALDASANQLLKTLPGHVRKDIMMKLGEQTGVRNPSAWVAKAALQAGATKSAPAGNGSMATINNLDEQAQELLAALPESEQSEILRKLEEESAKQMVRNPSAWVAKAALSAGATPTRSGAGTPRGGGAYSGRAGAGLDADAKQVLQTLSHDQQEEIMAKLEEAKAAGQVRNPSGWVVKAAMNAGARPSGGGAQAGAQFGKGKGKGRYSPY